MSLDKRAARWTLRLFNRQNPIDLLKQVAKVINLISIQKITHHDRPENEQKNTGFLCNSEREVLEVQIPEINMGYQRHS